MYVYIGLKNFKLINVDITFNYFCKPAYEATVLKTLK
jgi:hypothetical protein